MGQAGVGDRGAVKVEILEVDEALEIFHALVGDFRILLQVQPGQRRQVLQMSQAGVGHFLAGQVQGDQSFEVFQRDQAVIGNVAVALQERDFQARIVLGQFQRQAAELLDLGDRLLLGVGALGFFLGIARETRGQQEHEGKRGEAVHGHTSQQFSEPTVIESAARRRNAGIIAQPLSRYKRPAVRASSLLARSAKASRLFARQTCCSLRGPATIALSAGANLEGGAG